MKAGRWRAAKRLFQETVELEESARGAYLDLWCAGDQALRAEVVALLQAHAEAGNRFEAPARGRGSSAPDGDDALLPERVGPYRLLRELGRGGMGTVYLGVREGDELEQPVAVKVIKRGMDSEVIVRRFRNERLILASLHHPSIARLLEGGTTEDGLPYFVMEYVDGQPLDAYCEARGLGLEQRLELFRRVCSAVQHAHQNLVVHRDLKPTNILVTAVGEPKLLDFGIAKLLDPHTGPGTDLTAVDRALTPEYASPEQVRGETMTTVSDVYSLGVVLYQLLTGQLPYRFTTRNPQEVLRVVNETTPERPSTAAGKAAPPARRVALRRRLSGDLDNIVLKALHKDTARRYPSVEQLAEDIRRHLEGFPVRARSDSVGYRAGKFIGRHRVALLATCAAALALIATTGVALWQARVATTQWVRAEARFNDVRKLAHTVMFDMHDAIAVLPGSTSARRLLVSGALEYLDGLASEASGDASLQRERANAYERLADVQGMPNTPNLGDLRGALTAYRKAQEIRSELIGGGVEDPQLRREVSATCLKLATILQYSGDPASGAEQARQSAAIEEALSISDSTNAQRLRLGRSYAKHGYMLGTIGKTVESLARLRQAIAVLAPLAIGEDREASDVLSSAYTYLADILAGGEPVAGVVPDLPAALLAERQALALSEALLRAEPTSGVKRRNVMVDLLKLGEIAQRSANPATAIEHYRAALSIIEDLSREDPANVQAQSDQAFVCQRLGTVMAQQGDPRGGAELLWRALNLLEEVSRKDPSSVMTRARVAHTHGGLGYAHAALAAEPARTRGERIGHYRKAKSHFAQGRAFWLEMRTSGATIGEESEIPDQLGRQIELCDRALAKLTAGAA